MMRKITFLCDRCHKTIEGQYNPDTGETEGYYNVKSDEFKELNLGSERLVCDHCIDGKIHVPYVRYPNVKK